MPVIHHQRIARTLPKLLSECLSSDLSRVEAWVFEDEASRRDAERSLRSVGIEARFRSAYKPLLHFFLEEVDLHAIRRAKIRLPIGDLLRYRLECYPLASLLPDAVVMFEPGDGRDAYQVTIDGEFFEVFAPNLNGANTGWLRTWGPDGKVEDSSILTDFQSVFDGVLQAIKNYPWPIEAPYFEKMRIDVGIGGIERRLPFGEECVSTREALHEELYFAASEWFALRAGCHGSPANCAIGQIIPDIRDGQGETHFSIRLLPHGRHQSSLRFEKDVVWHVGDLHEMGRPPSEASMKILLDNLPGDRFTHHSHEGRPIDGIHLNGNLPGIVVTGGQHANETSGIVGALRSIPEFARRHGANVAVVPLENPDGYAVHARLKEHNPLHMLHAARYTALGDDLQTRIRRPFGEKLARLQALALAKAKLHISLHGYPAHEWVRPLSGYLPKGFESWTIPRGFFLILTRRPGLDGLPFLREVTRRLNNVAGLMEFNGRQLRAWEQHCCAISFPVTNGIPCLVLENDDIDVPYLLTTEFPDETIYDDAFRFAHTVQLQTVLAAAECYWEGWLKV